ncbi:hypothetical protein KKA27_00240 [Patescibacteria group bacterium]|nr:hypothetical protein [Patescibacteria group bacterium]MBU2633571.1 hypothetical protein [Patescibacteria group bacterium]
MTKLFRVFLVSLMFLGIIVAPVLAEQPTPAQLKQFWGQVEKGAITKDSLGKFLKGTEPTIKQPTSLQRSREIMGRNYFGIEEAISHFGVRPTADDVETLTNVPFSEQTLQECKDTYILIAVFPMSILDVRKVDNSFFYSSTGGWYKDEKFAENKGKTSWYLVKKTPVKNSTSKTWKEQQGLLADNEETPTARVVVYAIIGHYKNTGERLFEKIYARCSDLDSDGDRVYVGYFDSDGLRVDYYRDDSRFGSLGVSSSRKFN